MRSFIFSAVVLGVLLVSLSPSSILAFEGLNDNFLYSRPKILKPIPRQTLKNISELLAEFGLLPLASHRLDFRWQSFEVDQIFLDLFNSTYVYLLWHGKATGAGKNAGYFRASSQKIIAHLHFPPETPLLMIFSNWNPKDVLDFKLRLHKIMVSNAPRTIDPKENILCTKKAYSNYSLFPRANALGLYSHPCFSPTQLTARLKNGVNQSQIGRCVADVMENLEFDFFRGWKKLANQSYEFMTNTLAFSLLYVLEKTRDFEEFHSAIKQFSISDLRKKLGPEFQSLVDDLKDLDPKLLGEILCGATGSLLGSIAVGVTQARGGAAIYSKLILLFKRLKPIRPLISAIRNFKQNNPREYKKSKGQFSKLIGLYLSGKIKPRDSAALLALAKQKKGGGRDALLASLCIDKKKL